MRLGEYLPWIIATATTLLFVSAVLPERWSERRKRAFKVAIGVILFLLVGVYWLITGEKFDETAYRIVLCRIYEFERCTSVEKTTPDQRSFQQIAREAEALRKAAEDIRREQREAAARRADQERELAEKQRVADEARKQEAALAKAKADADAADEARRREEARAKAKTDADAADEARKREEARAKAKADADAAVEALRQREAVGQTAIANAFKFWRQGNFKVAAAYAEDALKVFAELPNSNERNIRNMTAEAHAIVGLGLALLGATPKDKAYGCSRLNTARRIYSEIGNTPMVSRTDQDLHTGGCAAR